MPLRKELSDAHTILELPVVVALWVFRPTTDYRASESGPDRAVGRTVNCNVEDRTVNGILSVARLSTVKSRIRTLY
jgi:hypothetical protein